MEGGRRARRERQEGVETVAVSQAPVVSEAAAVATPAAGGDTLAALPSAVQDLARFFLSLSGSASLGAAGGIAGVAAPASGAVVQLCPSAPGGGAVAFGAATAIPAGAGDPPSALAAVPGSSGRQQRQGTSRPSDGTDRRSKKRLRGRSPSPGPSRRRERSYRSDSDSSGDDRAETSPPRAGHAPGGTPGDFRSAPAGDRSPRPGPSGRQEMTEPRLLLPELDMRLEVLPAIFAPLRRVTARHVLALRVGRRGHPRERTIIARVLVVDPTHLRVERMTTGLVPWTR